jgi:hypothetical protein
LRSFAERDDVQVNRVEIALDIITPFAFELKRAASVGFVQRHHTTTRTARRSKSNWKPRREVTIFPNDNFRTGDLGCPGSTFQAYDDKPSKVTGEIDCFHLEVKVNGVRALRQLGINTLSDLLAFDHARFWQHHFIIAEIDMERVGRYHVNQRDGTRRRAPLIHRSFNVDAAVGNVLWRVFAAHPDQPDYSLQQFIDQYRSHSYVMACRMHHSGRPPRWSAHSYVHSVTDALLHRFGVLPEPDLSLLEPERCYPPRLPRRREYTP